MDYQQTLAYLYNQLPQYQKIGGKALKPSLDNITALCRIVGNPHKKLKAIHIAGTNGKGSTTSLVASALIENDYKTGVFTSPHLIDFRERISINGEKIPQDYVLSFVQQYKDAVKKINPSFFEWTMVLAFAYFQSQKVDFVVIETGLGGRLDSSNIVQPLVSVITTIGIDHVQYLGNSYREIAFEKGGIIKENTPCVVGYGINKEALTELQRLALEKKAPFIIAQPLKQKIKTDLLGTIQQYNIATALTTLRVLKEKTPLSKEQIIKGFENVTQNTLLRGRWEKINKAPQVVVDIAHNVQAVESIIGQLKHETYNNLHIVWGMVADKDVAKVVELLPKNAHYYLCQPNINRALNVLELAKYFDSKHYTVYDNCLKAYTQALETANQDDLILIAGSNFVVAEILSGIDVQGATK